LNISKGFYIPGVLFKIYKRGKKIMEETLYNIEIHRDDTGFTGKLFSDMDGIKEFKNEYLDKLLRDITIDMQLALDEFSNRTTEYIDTHEIIK
jgi:hypothetical protein